MKPAIKGLYDYFEQFRGRKLVVILLASFVLFLVVGIALGQLLSLIPGTPDESIVVSQSEKKNPNDDVLERAGKVVYTSSFAEQGISYKLINEKGEDIILLKANDDKLKVVEGAFVKLRGKLSKTSDGKDILLVDQVVFN